MYSTVQIPNNFLKNTQTDFWKSVCSEHTNTLYFSHLFLVFKYAINSFHSILNQKIP